MLTKQHLLELRERALVKRQEQLAMLHEANGAIDTLDYLLQELEQSEPKQEGDDHVSV